MDVVFIYTKYQLSMGLLLKSLYEIRYDQRKFSSFRWKLSFFYEKMVRV